MEASGGADGGFEVSSDPETVAASPQFEGANVCRAAAISTMLGRDRVATVGLAEPLAELGFDGRLRTGEIAGLDIDPFESFGDLWPGLDRAEPRIDLWQRLNDEGDPQAAVAFLVAVLGSPLERESAAAAAALWRAIVAIDRERLWHYARSARWWLLREDLALEGRHWPWSERSWFPVDGVSLDEDRDTDTIKWNPDRWTDLYQRAIGRQRIEGREARYEAVLRVGLLVHTRLAQALRSPDPITRTLAAATFPPPDESDGDVHVYSEPTSRKGTAVSTMIHGTWAWKGNWWRPRPGSFHEFILHNHRRNLYAGGARFSWSGAYRCGDREQAAIDFCDWSVSEVAPGGVQTVFAHSYGGEVAARAVARGAPIDELVLLSAPVTRPINAIARSGLRIIDVRLAFDPVLALARKRQRLSGTTSATEVILRRWRLDHSASHEADIWRAEAVAERSRL